MERLHRTVVQLEEAKRQIEQGDIAHLRLGIILLDNAVEVMMHRVIEDQFQHASMWARMLKNFPDKNLEAKGAPGPFLATSCGQPPTMHECNLSFHSADGQI